MWKSVITNLADEKKPTGWQAFGSFFASSYW